MAKLRSSGPAWFVWVGRILVETSCAWEIIALHSGARVPTISQTIHRHRDKLAAKMVLSAILVWLMHHLLIEERAMINAVKEIVMDELEVANP